VEPTPNTRMPPPFAALGRHVKCGHVRSVAQEVAENAAEDVPQGVSQDLTFGARAARALLATPPPPLSPSYFAQLATR